MACRVVPTLLCVCLFLVLAARGQTQTPPKAALDQTTAHQPPAYQITDLGPTVKSTDDVTPALDGMGRVLTWQREQDFVVHASLRDDGKRIELGSLSGYPDTYPADISADTVVGTSRASADTRYYRAFLWQNGRMEDIGTLGGKYGRAYAINAHGQIVGGANTATNAMHAFLRAPQPQSPLRDLGTLANGNYSIAYGINRAGQVVGVANVTPNGKNHAFLWDQGRMRDLGVLPGGAFSYAHAINDRGQVVGWGNDAEGEMHAILWQHGAARDLGDLGTDPSSAWGINNWGQVVGASAVQANRPLHAVLWDNGKIRDLNALIPPSSGWQLQFAYRINDHGQIVGIGIYHNELHAYLLTPSARAPKQATPADGAAVTHPREAGQANTTGLQSLNGPAFPFSLPDTEGHAHTLGEFKGKRVALFFFCGCERCQHCAQTWGQFQHGGAVMPAETADGAAPAEGQAPITVVVYMGDADAARDFARTTGLDLARTLLLPDPKMDVTSAYHALPCPRVFVLDGKQIVRYANTHADDDPLKAAASTIDTRALEALKSKDEGRLVLVAEHGIEAVGTTGAAHDFGTIDALGATQLQQTFHLRNDGSEPVLINYIQPSCGCASAVLSAEGGGDANTIAPGAQVAVRVTVDIAHLHPGHIDKYAMIYVKGNVRPAFTLEVRGELPPLIAYRPHVLNFDRINAGMGNEQTLTVTLDRRVVAANSPPVLICTNPDVEVKLQPEATPATVARQNQNTVVRTYRVTLSRQARLGAVSGAIAFVPADSKSLNSRRPPFGQAALISDAIGGESVILSGEIVGKFYDVPYIVFFGTVSQGEEATRQVKLIGLAPDILSGLSVSCSVPTVAARLVAVPPAAQANPVGPFRPTVMLEIKMNNQTPIGGLSGEVTVTARDGERLVIPIVGDVIKTAAH